MALGPPHSRVVAEEGVPFWGLVEVDEYSFGGKEKNKHYRKKAHAGRGTIGKSIVVGMKDRETNAVKAAVIDNTDRVTL